MIEPVVVARTPGIRTSFENSLFDNLWLFMANENRTPFSLSKTTIVTPPEK